VLGEVFCHVLDSPGRLRSAGRPPRDASVRTVGPAILGGIVGALIGGFPPAIIAGSAPDLTVSVILAAAVAGGLGWTLAAVVG